MDMLIVGIGGLSALFLPLEACALFVTKAVWLLDLRTKGAALEWKEKRKRF